MTEEIQELLVLYALGELEGAELQASEKLAADPQYAPFVSEIRRTDALLRQAYESESNSEARPRTESPVLREPFSHSDRFRIRIWSLIAAVAILIAVPTAALILPSLSLPLTQNQNQIVAYLDSGIRKEGPATTEPISEPTVTKADKVLQPFKACEADAKAAEADRFEVAEKDGSRLYFAAPLVEKAEREESSQRRKYSYKKSLFDSSLDDSTLVDSPIPTRVEFGWTESKTLLARIVVDGGLLTAVDFNPDTVASFRLVKDGASDESRAAVYEIVLSGDEEFQRRMSEGTLEAFRIKVRLSENKGAEYTIPVSFPTPGQLNAVSPEFRAVLSRVNAGASPSNPSNSNPSND